MMMKRNGGRRVSWMWEVKRQAEMNRWLGLL
jgi:hypothetical protein